jgi:hypothetical protein
VSMRVDQHRICPFSRSSAAVALSSPLPNCLILACRSPMLKQSNFVWLSSQKKSKLHPNEWSVTFVEKHSLPNFQTILSSSTWRTAACR